ETLNGVASNGTIAVAVGNKGKVLTSADGITWSSRSVESFSGNMYLDQVIWDGFQFIAVGIDNQAGTSSGWKRIIYTSPNGINWTNRYPSSSSTQQYHFRSVASSGGTILVGGDNGLLVRSIDSGTSWSTIGAGTISSSHTISGLAYGEGTFAVTTHPQSGSILSGDGRVYTTADGTVLTNVSSGAALGTGFYLDTVAYLNDRFISSGLAATLRASTNKAATFAISTATTEQAHALAYGNGVYIAAGVDSGNNMVHALSTDGANWTQTSAPNGVVSEKAAAFFNNSFLIVGGGGQIWQSGSVATGIQPLELLKSPANLSVYEGASATLSVVAAGGGTLSYQWKKNGVALGSGTGSTYTIASAQTTDSGSYSVQVSDSASLTTLQSGSALLSVTGTTLTIANLIAAQPSPNVSMIQGSDATLGITLYSTGTYATDYTLYYGATPLAITGTIPASGTASAVAYIPLKSLTTGGSYSVKFSRYLSATERGSATSSAFNVSFLSWADYAAGTYQTLLANDASALSALNDGSVYRGFLSLSVSKFGSVSGKLYYNEATLLSGGTSGERLYAPIVRAFSGKFAPKAGNPSTMTFTPVRLGTAAQSTRESLTIDLDLSASPAKMSASLTDSVSLASGSCLSSASDVTKVASGLSTVDLAGLVGKYLLSANLANSAGVYEQQAYVQAQVLSTGRLLWTSRLRGHTGSGATYLNTNDATAPFAGLYEGSQITSSKLHNAYSLMGEVAFRLTGGSWAASIGSPELQDKLEKQASYVARQTTGSGSLAAVYNSAYFSSGTNSTGVKFISFSNNDVARWCGATFTGIPAYLPTARPLTLSVQDPLNSGTAALSWAVTIGSSGAVAAVPQTVNGVTSPNVVLQFTKTTGLWSGVYVLSGARRTLVGASLDQGTAAATRAAQGWAESGVFPATKTGTWTLSK
ncbi:MAG: hypothetical protein EBS01_07310, partial [Verrucomicrobia bacterium]|nr:hypothetical protein [Verrucomicrobiota bacterium]